MNVETVMAAETLGYWAHVYPPLDLAEIRNQLVEGLVAARQDYAAARTAGDGVAADAALAEIADLTTLCAAVADGIADQRCRWLASDPPVPWPLGAVPA